MWVRTLRLYGSGFSSQSKPSSQNRICSCGYDLSKSSVHCEMGRKRGHDIGFYRCTAHSKRWSPALVLISRDTVIWWDPIPESTRATTLHSWRSGFAAERNSIPLRKISETPRRERKSPGRCNLSKLAGKAFQSLCGRCRSLAFIAKFFRAISVG